MNSAQISTPRTSTPAGSTSRRAGSFLGRAGTTALPQTERGESNVWNDPGDDDAPRGGSRGAADLDRHPGQRPFPRRILGGVRPDRRRRPGDGALPVARRMDEVGVAEPVGPVLPA